MTPFAAAPWYLGEGRAVLSGDGGLTFAELADAADRLARSLSTQGLAPGQLVLAEVDPPLDLLVLQHALARCDAALLPVPPDLEPARRATLGALSGAEWGWLPPERQADSGRLVRQAPSAPGASPALWPEDPLALVVETSGSSGSPRAAMLTQGNVLASATRVNARLGLEPGDHWLCCLPRHHIGGLAIAYRCALAGATLAIHSRFEVGIVAADLVRLPVTHISLVPSMLAQLLDQIPAPPQSLRVALVGGQALSPILAQRAMDAGWPLYVTYGMTETGSQVASAGPLSEVPALGLIGSPLPGLILDCPDCDEAPRALRLRGDLVMAGYANPARISGLGLNDGWLTAADLACRTATGELCILGRVDEALVIGGEQVYPGLVAQRLTAAPGVEAAIAVGLLDPVWGHRLVAVYAGVLDPEGLAAWCETNLRRGERPRSFLQLETLPLLASGKYDLQAIRRLAGQRQGS